MGIRFNAFNEAKRQTSEIEPEKVQEDVVFREYRLRAELIDVLRHFNQEAAESQVPGIAERNRDRTENSDFSLLNLFLIRLRKITEIDNTSGTNIPQMLFLNEQNFMIALKANLEAFLESFLTRNQSTRRQRRIFINQLYNYILLEAAKLRNDPTIPHFTLSQKRIDNMPMYEVLRKRSLLAFLTKRIALMKDAMRNARNGDKAA
jgi:hypothetical protein